MMLLSVMYVLRLLTFHGPDGRTIDINPREVDTVRQPFEGDHLPNGTNCVVNMADGKFNLLKESCDVVRDRIERKK